MPLLFVVVRFLQGWTWECGMLYDKKIELLQWTFPHQTLLPGLQFSLAGLIGKPDVFFDIPVIRFMFEFLSYMCVRKCFASHCTAGKQRYVPDLNRGLYRTVIDF